MDDLLDAPHRAHHLGRSARQARRRDQDGADGGRRHGRAGRRARGPGDRAVLLHRGAGGGRDHPAAHRLPPRHRRRDRAGLPALPRRREDQPRPLLHDHRRAAHLRGRGHPGLRRARPAGSGDPARPEHARLRRQRRGAARLLVRRAAQGRLQLLPADHRAGSRGLDALRRRRAHAVPAPPAHQDARARATPSRRLRMSRRSAAVVSCRAVTAAVALAGCTSTAPDRSAPGEPGPISVKAADTACDVSATSAPAGKISFSINNTGTKTTEFYLYGTGDRIMGEVENIGPGPHPPAHRRGARRRHVHHGLQARHGRRRHPRAVHGHRLRRARSVDENAKLAEATAGWKRYVTSQVDALVPKTQEFVDAVKKGDVATAKTLFPVSRILLGAHRAGGGVLRRHRPEDRRPRGRRARPRRAVDRLPPAGEGPVGHRPAAGLQRDRRPADGRHQGPAVAHRHR